MDSNVKGRVRALRKRGTIFGAAVGGLSMMGMAVLILFDFPEWSASSLLVCAALGLIVGALVTALATELAHAWARSTTPHYAYQVTLIGVIFGIVGSVLISFLIALLFLGIVL
ncbi:MAG: hypothetical protein R3272_17180 [Candidatus Promineifilaceae bacterium]|nr:hypothetical protein [Candidatus Promineifilaceae bacterium]